jgi:hypothetical protein
MASPRCASFTIADTWPFGDMHNAERSTALGSAAIGGRTRRSKGNEENIYLPPYGMGYRFSCPHRVYRYFCTIHT